MPKRLAFCANPRWRLVKNQNPFHFNQFSHLLSLACTIFPHSPPTDSTIKTNQASISSSMSISAFNLVWRSLELTEGSTSTSLESPFSLENVPTEMLSSVAPLKKRLLQRMAQAHAPATESPSLPIAASSASQPKNPPSPTKLFNSPLPSHPNYRAPNPFPPIICTFQRLVAPSIFLIYEPSKVAEEDVMNLLPLSTTYLIEDS